MTPRGEYQQFELTLDPNEIIVDSFAGGGGASLGIEWALGRGPHIAINHDREAIALHKANHPDSEHYPEDVWHVDPVEACAGRKVGLMWLSPDCKHFSKAKGGKPISKKIRGLAWTACRWAKAVKPRVIVLENVEEFQDWGPLYPANHRIKKLRNRPIPKKKGQTFKSFIARLRRLGYKIEWKLLRACDYGAPTIRNRFFLIARCDGRPIVWPQPTHGKDRPTPWRTAAECIDWSHDCPSIFSRKKDLAPNTMRRIARGIQRYVIDSPRPFIVGVGGRQGQSPERLLDRPYQTITSKADSAIVTPRIRRLTDGESPEKREYWRPIDEAFGLVSATVARIGQTGGAGKYVNDIREPLTTITSKAEHLVVAPFLKPRYGEDPNPARRGGLGQAPRVRSLEEPMPVVVPTGNGGDIVATYLAKHNGGNEATGQSFDEPVHTITSTDQKALVTAHIKRDFGQSVGSDAEEPLGTITPGGQGKASLVTSNLVSLRGTNESHLHGDSVEEPVRTISAGGNHIAEVRAFLISFYGTDQNTGALTQPAPTVTSKDRFGLVTVAGAEYVIADIGMRMLQPRELYTAQGFPASYRIDIEYNGKPMTKTAQVRMCGNSVCPPLAAAIVAANIGSASIIPAARVA